MTIPYILHDLTYGAQMQFLGCIYENDTDIDNIVKAVISVVGDEAMDLPFDLVNDFAISKSDFFLRKDDELSIMRIFCHISHLIKSYQYDQTKFDDGYWFTHKNNEGEDIDYTISRNIVENLLSKTLVHRMSVIDTIAVQEFRRVHSEPDRFKKDFEMAIMQVAILAKCDTDATIIDKPERDAHYDNRAAEFSNLSAVVVQDIVFFFKIISNELNPIPDINSFLTVYPLLEEIVVQANTTKHLRQEAVRLFNKQDGIPS